ncbi:uncharacterized protein C1orf198-like [Mytilus trossulus]|uniref:uncharacterized protein C1orf198-like n=1 Tax=Mytilus trossulus TaxID=6551 RepID=UPI003003F431
MDTISAAYFASINPLTRKIVQETQMVKSLFSEKWETFDEKRQDHILDDYFVHPDVRERYKDCGKGDNYPISYPVLKVQMGEKIVVDETNDFWTWQDEFSGPFSWKTKSQQDLTLLDLEPEQMTRQSKTRRRSSRDLSEEASREAPKEFEVMEPGKSLWNSEFKNLKDVVLTKAHNEKADIENLLPQKKLNTKNDNSPEEINYAFNRDSFIETDEQKGGNGKTDSSYYSNYTEKRPAEQAIASNGSVSKRKHDIEMSVFENPMISHVVEDEDSLSSATTSPSHRPLLKGFNADGSPSRKPLLKGDSQESYSSGKSQLYEPPAQSIDHEDRLDGRTNDKSHLVSNVDYEDTELIAVDMNKGSYSLNDSHGSMSSLNLQKTGFDFLDEW